MIEKRVKKYVETINSNIDDRFPSESLAILASFSIFDVSQIPNETSQEFEIYGEAEITEIGNHFYLERPADRDILLKELEIMKIEMLHLKKS